MNIMATSSELPRLPRASIQPEAMRVIELAAARNGVKVPDLLRMALSELEWVRNEAQKEGVDIDKLLDVKRGGYRGAKE